MKFASPGSGTTTLALAARVGFELLTASLPSSALAAEPLHARADPLPPQTAPAVAPSSGPNSGRTVDVVPSGFFSGVELPRDDRKIGQDNLAARIVKNGAVVLALRPIPGTPRDIAPRNPDNITYSAWGIVGVVAPKGVSNTLIPEDKFKGFPFGVPVLTEGIGGTIIGSSHPSPGEFTGWLEHHLESRRYGGLCDSYNLAPPQFVRETERFNAAPTTLVVVEVPKDGTFASVDAKLLTEKHGMVLVRPISVVAQAGTGAERRAIVMNANGQWELGPRVLITHTLENTGPFSGKNQGDLVQALVAQGYEAKFPYAPQQ